MLSPLKQNEYIWHGKTGFNHRLNSAPWTEMNEVPLLVFLEDLEENTFEDEFGDH